MESSDNGVEQIAAQCDTKILHRTVRQMMNFRRKEKIRDKVKGDLIRHSVGDTLSGRASLVTVGAKTPFKKIACHSFLYAISFFAWSRCRAFQKIRVCFPSKQPDRAYFWEYRVMRQS